MSNPVLAEIQTRRIHGRRIKRLRKERRDAVAAMAECVIDLDGAAAGGLDPKQFVSAAAAGSPRLPREDDTQKIHLEIGFGTGEHLVHLAARQPQNVFLAAEPYTAGFGHLLKLAQQQALKNIRAYPNDGFALMQALASNSIDHAYLLFPDPWPKTRHQKRRFVQSFTINEFARIIKPQGTLLLASDDVQMVEWMLLHMLPRRDFRWLAARAADWRAALPGHILSRYAEKAQAAGKPLYYLHFSRL